MKADDVKKINTTALAYMGDAVYEQAVREHILSKGSYNVNKLHRMSVRFVNASAQAAIIKTIFEELTEQEQALVKRARNRKSATRAKNADPVTYKWATAFEALVGYLYLSEERERLEWLLERAIETIGK
ncbi:MAG: ribonuclease III domain-containing protein [Bacillota bacterium]|nr:ribonuclease III domain-containing protein [Bacillota bacterium]